MDAKTILYVEDNESYRKMLSIRLKSEGYEVVTAVNGLEGYNLAKRIQPDLMILDINMPEMDGLKVCRLIKFDKKLQHIPIVMLTCKSLPQDVMAAARAHADAFIMKSTRSEVLIDTLHQFLPPAR